MIVTENIHNKLVKLFGKDNTDELITFMEGKKLIPVIITERPQYNDKIRHVISTTNNDTHTDIQPMIYVTYNKIKDDFIYTKYIESKK